MFNSALYTVKHLCYVYSMLYRECVTFIDLDSTAPRMLLCVRVSIVGLLYTLSTNAGTVLRCVARSKSSTGMKKKQIWDFNTKKKMSLFQHGDPPIIL